MSSDAPKMFGLGLACLAFAALLAWLSAPTTLHVTRAADESFTVTLDSRVLGLIAVQPEQLTGVRRPRLVSGREPGSRSHTPDFLLFETAAGPVNLGRGQQLFMRDFSEIDAFFKEGTRRELSLSSTGRGEEFRRFIFATLAVAALGLGGLACLWGSFRR